jgi:hypothetical protein
MVRFFEESPIPLDKDYAHQVFDHAVAYVDGRVHTNGLENLWSPLKTWNFGNVCQRRTVPSVSVDEQTYRFNNRKLNDAERFSMMVSGIVNKRVTFQQLTGKAENVPAEL